MENRHWVLRQWKTDTSYQNNGQQTPGTRTMENRCKVPEKNRKQTQGTTMENRRKVELFFFKLNGKQAQGIRKMENGHKVPEKWKMDIGH